ncbi:DUF421 domain-containing protein [Aurantiacibacter suaedae]|uniref:DUF421 domain-containing protein n=1 Tax=Aurantiacibacter suaedae TaxID=2545755 RepID=UPI0010F8B881|nr:YetF domain-containing protein [Aurantiacibacter suaedae]
MWFDSWKDIAQIGLTSLCIYALIIVVLLLAGKRSLAKLNVFDFVVTIALGSILASTMILKDISLSEGFAAIAVLVVLQFIVSWLSMRVGWFKRLIRSDARLIFRDGRFLAQAMRDERVTEGEILAAIRKKGHGRTEDVAAVVLETDGALSVLANRPAIECSALGPMLSDSEGKE